ncbi:hypothetical protein MHYP_G00004500 [Metynnis hypsauchen]
MSNELRSQNLEVNVKYKAMIKQKTEELEQEREMIRDSVAVIKESEAWILSVVPLVVIQKHRLMQKLHIRGVYKPLESPLVSPRKQQTGMIPNDRTMHVHEYTLLGGVSSCVLG